MRVGEILENSVSVKKTAVFDDSYIDFFVDHTDQFKTHMCSRHYHSLNEIYYYLGNKMKYIVGNKSYVISKNDILLINKFVFHKSEYNFNDENERILIEFDNDIFSLISDKTLVNDIQQLFQNIEIIRLGETDHKNNIHSLFLNLVSNYNSKSQYGKYISKLNLIELCLKLVDITNPHDMRSYDNKKEPKNTVMEVIKYIIENYNTEISLDELANSFYFNKYHLCHLFKNETGLSIIDFINRKRLFEAEKLLKTTDYNVTEICYKVGFSSVNYFIKQFKHTYNTTPKKFKDSMNIKKAAKCQIKK
jgi:YesN/AraC family two-component response regulator